MSSPTLFLALFSMLSSLVIATSHINGQVVFQEPMQIPLYPQYVSSLQTGKTDNAASEPRRARKIAIIGAGPGGSSAAFFLSKAQSKLESMGAGAQGLDVTLFERDERIGGRTTVVHPYEDESLPAIELGASIFADVNKNLQRASRQFNLTTGAHIGEPGETGVWDGQQFLIEGLDNGWWSSAKIFWRYGYSPSTTSKLVGKTVESFLRLYDPTFMHKSKDDANDTDSGFPWGSIEKVSSALSLKDLAARTGGDYFYRSGVSKLFTEEIIEAFTLVNYGQEVDSIHGVGASVSLAASGATGVVGGNYKIFERMVGSFEALRLRMSVHGEVTGLAKFKTTPDAIKAGKMTTAQAKASGLLDDKTGLPTEVGRTTKWWLGTKSGYGDLFDAVFVATPWHLAGISLLNTHAVIPTPPYVHLHVTLVVTKSDKPNPAYFGRGEKDVLPKSILTSHESIRKEEARREKEKKKKKSKDGPRLSKRWPWGGDDDKKRGPRIEFNSLTFLGTIPSRSEPDKEDHIVKIFSAERLDDEKLKDIFGADNIAWTYRKEWDAYPYLTPTMTFPKLQVDENLYYLNAMELLVSTMETASVSARNAVALYLKKEYGAKFVHGGKDCPWTKASTLDNNDNAFEADWAGWGCQSA